MEKLQLAHLAPYLPYKLKIKGDSNGEIAILSTLSEMSVNIDGRGTQYGMWSGIDEIKPILRPLSDLTKNIEGIGIPMVELAKIWDRDSLWVLDGYYAKSSKVYFSFSENSFFAKIDGDISPINHQFELFQKLFELHFDVFGLIEKRLAIDVNTLK